MERKTLSMKMKIFGMFYGMYKLKKPFKAYFIYISGGEGGIRFLM